MPERGRWDRMTHVEQFDYVVALEAAIAGIKPLRSRVLHWVTIALMLLVAATAVNVLGQSFGLWGNHSRTVTIICDRAADGTAKCLSQPINVEAGR